MKNLKEWFKKAEQSLSFFGGVAYLMTFMYVFSEQMRTTNWMGLVWLAQFVLFGVYMAARSKKKGWKWPERP